MRGPARALAGDARVPGDKSIGHRAVIFGAHRRRAACACAGSRAARTTAAPSAALARARRRHRASAAPGELEIDGVGLDGLRAPAGELDCGNSGTSMRLLAGLLAARPFASRLVGDRYLHARPMRRVAEPLRAMGARIDGAGRAASRARSIRRSSSAASRARLRGIALESQVARAQVKSAILLAALGADGPTTVVEPARSRDHTERMLASLGVPLTVDGLRGHARSRAAGIAGCAARDLEVPGDLSSAAFLLGAATLVPGSRVVVRGVGVNPTRTGVPRRARARWAAHLTLENDARRGRRAGRRSDRARRRRCAASRSPASWRCAPSTSCRCSPRSPRTPTAPPRSATPPSCASRSRIASPRRRRCCARSASRSKSAPTGFDRRAAARRVARRRRREPRRSPHRDGRRGLRARRSPARRASSTRDNIATSFPGFAAALARARRRPRLAAQRDARARGRRGRLWGRARRARACRDRRAARRRAARRWRRRRRRSSRGAARSRDRRRRRRGRGSARRGGASGSAARGRPRRRAGDRGGGASRDEPSGSAAR